MKKTDVIKYILRDANHGNFISSLGGSAWAPSNVALCKYWGKRNIELNLPITSSLSVSLKNIGALTQIKQNGTVDSYTVNGKFIPLTSKFARRLQKFLDLFRPNEANYFVNIETNVPIAAGFASSACGFAALVQALNHLYDWQLNKKELSILARLGSGSASRSLYDGFVEWCKGESYDGMDSYAVKLAYVWPHLRIGALTISTKEKSTSSTDAMQHTVNTSPLYGSWLEVVERDMANIKLALANNDFILLGKTAENNALVMHAIMSSARPSVVYTLPETISAIAKVRELRFKGIPVFFTQDAGPNLHLLFLAENESEILRVFPDLNIVSPFVGSSDEQIILVDNSNTEIGSGEKLAVHIDGKLHKAFSVVILREQKDKTEILLQQRSVFKYHSANLWSNTCCGHLHVGESTKVAAERRLYEEMGFRTSLEEIGQFHYAVRFSDVGLIENELDSVFIGFCSHDEFTVNSDEVKDYRWIDLAALQDELHKSPQKYTIWLPLVLALLLKYFGKPAILR